MSLSAPRTIHREPQGVDMQARELVVEIPKAALLVPEQKMVPALETEVKALDEEGNVYSVYAVKYDPENQCFFLHIQAVE